MESKGLRKKFSIFIIVFILSWSFAPSVSMAFFIKPGKPITPGEAITPGQPISGGQFIIPGDPISGGKSYLPGSEIIGGKNPVSGQPIIPEYQGIRGKFIIPNVAIPPGQWLFTGSPITSGEGPSGGQSLTGGTGPNGGEGLTGGTGPSGGQSLIGGTGPNGGQGLTGGTGPNGGQGLTGGTGPNGGEGLTGGTGPNGGQGPSGGTGPNGGEGLTGGTGSNGGEGPSGGTGPNGGEGPAGGTGSGGGENSGGDPKSSSNYWGIAGDLIDTTSTTIGFLKPFLEGLTAGFAGFNLVQNPAGNYTVVGKDKYNNKFLDFFYDNYREYDYHGQESFMGGTTKEPGKVKAFFDSKNLFLIKQGGLKKTWDNLKSSLNESYNVFSSKDFWTKSNFKTLTGPVSFVATGMSELSGEGKISSKLANLTVELGIGAVATAASSVAASIATYALAGSVLGTPGFGTAIGALVGLGVGLLSPMLFDMKIGGKSIKRRTSEMLATGYSYIGKGVKKVTNYAKGLYTNAKKLIGFTKGKGLLKLATRRFG